MHDGESFGLAIVQLNGSILNVALSEIGIALNIGINNLSWMVAAYFVVFAEVLLPLVPSFRLLVVFASASPLPSEWTRERIRCGAHKASEIGEPTELSRFLSEQLLGQTRLAQAFGKLIGVRGVSER
jgi:hypothetical protein